MDLDFFLKRRLEYASYFFEHARKPFEDIITTIEKEEPPFTSKYDESDEIPFLKEWIDAKTGLESVGITALSMLASSLQLFLNNWVRRLESSEQKYTRTHKKRGWFYAYRIIFEKVGLNLDKCPADLELIEQAILARNRGQHPEQLTELQITHSKYDLEKYPSPYFVSEADRKIIESENGEMSWWLIPNVYVDFQKFQHVSSEIRKLSKWLENEYWRAVSA